MKTDRERVEELTASLFAQFLKDRYKMGLGGKSEAEILRKARGDAWQIVRAPNESKNASEWDGYTMDELKDKVNQLRNLYNEANEALAGFSKLKEELSTLADKRRADLQDHDRKMEFHTKLVAELREELQVAKSGLIAAMGDAATWVATKLQFQKELVKTQSDRDVYALHSGRLQGELAQARDLLTEQGGEMVKLKNQLDIERSLPSRKALDKLKDQVAALQEHAVYWLGQENGFHWASKLVSRGLSTVVMMKELDRLGAQALDNAEKKKSMPTITKAVEADRMEREAGPATGKTEPEKTAAIGLTPEETTELERAMDYMGRSLKDWILGSRTTPKPVDGGPSSSASTAAYEPTADNLAELAKLARKVHERFERPTPGQGFQACPRCGSGVKDPSHCPVCARCPQCGQLEEKGIAYSWGLKNEATCGKCGAKWDPATNPTLVQPFPSSSASTAGGADPKSEGYGRCPACGGIAFTIGTAGLSVVCDRCGIYLYSESWTPIDKRGLRLRRVIRELWSALASEATVGKHGGVAFGRMSAAETYQSYKTNDFEPGTDRKAIDWKKVLGT